MSIVGKFLFVSGQVIVLKVVDLDLKTTCEEPGVHYLPITPLFASFCAPCVAEAVATDDECNFFVLGKKIYNTFTSSSEDVEIPCVYDHSNPRFSAIAEASKKALIFSAAGELFIGENLAQIICTEVDWVFPKVKNEQVSPGKSMRRQKFLSIEEKYVGKKSNNRRKVNNTSSSSLQIVVVDDNESHKKVCTELGPLNRPITRAKALQTTMDQVNRKGKGPELPCSNDEEEDLDLDH
ncbi:19527_t:CDS:2 [Entrophospora sp. SA101]|nr:19527_t:CDS:2 [Entrophospora sp. SA101]